MSFVAQAAAQVNIRPRKLGYLVRTGDSVGVRSAIGYASTEWGGVSHPIIPVRRRQSIDPASWQFLELLHPEVLIDYAGVEASLTDQLRSRLGAEVVTPPSFLLDEPGLHAMAAIPPTSLLARTMLVPGPRAPLSIQAALGFLPTDPDQRAIWDDSGAQISRTASWLDVLDGQLDVPSPLWITRQQHTLHMVKGSGLNFGGVFGGPVILFGWQRPKVSQVLWFWNIRAAASGLPTGSVLWLPPEAFGDPEVGLRVRAACRSKLLTTPDLLLLGLDKPASSAVAEAIGIRLCQERRVTYHLETPRLVDPPITYLTGVDPRDFVFAEREEGTQVPTPITVVDPITVVSLQSPVGLRPRYGKLRVEIGGVEQFLWPRRPAVAQLLADGATWTPAGLSFIRSPSPRYELSIRVPPAEAVLEALLKEAGWTWHISDKGRYAHALSAAAAGRLSVDSIHDPLALRVLRNLGSLSPKKATQALVRAGLSEATSAKLAADVLPSLVPNWKTSGEVTASLGTDTDHIGRQDVIAVLNRLLRDHLVHRAFRFECPNCGMRSYFQLSRSADHVECDGCAVTSPLQGSSGGEPDLAYGLNSLVDRALDQDCLGHLHAQDWIRTKKEAVWSIPGADLARIDGSATNEIDVLALSRGGLIVAEVKESVSGFTDEAVHKTADLARSLRADDLVLAAFGKWDEERLARLRDLAGTGFGLAIVGLDDLVA